MIVGRSLKKMVDVQNHSQYKRQVKNANLAESLRSKTTDRGMAVSEPIFTDPS